jgi:ribokinase
MTPEVFVAGALHLDVVVDAPHLPARDETVTGQAVAYRFGGKGGNQAVAAARMGARTVMLGRVGPDRFGQMILDALDAAGVDRARVATVPGASGMSVAVVDAAGDYGAVIVSGVNLQLQAEAPPPGTRVILLQNEVPEAVNLALAAMSGDARLILNAAPARPLPPALLSRVDVLVVNRVEAAMLSGSDDPATAATALRAQGPATVIVTLGGDGLVAATPDGLLTLPAPRVSVVSTHGAGDAFVGALAADLARGADLPGALTFAQAAAALTVTTHPDARDTITRARVEAFRAAL